jgi:hypothetical protein
MESFLWLSIGDMLMKYSLNIKQPYAHLECRIDELGGEDSCEWLRCATLSRDINADALVTH